MKHKRKSAYDAWLEDNQVSSANDEIEEVLAREKRHRVERTSDPLFDCDAYLYSLELSNALRRKARNNRPGIDMDRLPGSSADF